MIHASPPPGTWSVEPGGRRTPLSPQWPLFRGTCPNRHNAPAPAAGVAGVACKGSCWAAYSNSIRESVLVLGMQDTRGMLPLMYCVWAGTDYLDIIIQCQQQLVESPPDRRSMDPQGARTPPYVQAVSNHPGVAARIVEADEQKAGNACGILAAWSWPRSLSSSSAVQSSFDTGDCRVGPSRQVDSRQVGRCTQPFIVAQQSAQSRNPFARAVNPPSIADRLWSQTRIT